MDCIAHAMIFYLLYNISYRKKVTDLIKTHKPDFKLKLDITQHVQRSKPMTVICHVTEDNFRDAVKN